LAVDGRGDRLSGGTERDIPLVICEPR